MARASIRESGQGNFHGKKMSNSWIPVVAGILRKGERILVGRRPDGQLKDLWEFPGGKIEAGESPQEALKRELAEELGVEVLELSPVQLATTFSYPEVNILILLYLVHYWRGEVTAKHHRELNWVLPQDLLTLPIPEANRKIIHDILAILRVSR